MKRDSNKDPATDPKALLAKVLIGQVGYPMLFWNPISHLVIIE